VETANDLQISEFAVRIQIIVALSLFSLLELSDQGLDNLAHA